MKPCRTTVALATALALACGGLFLPVEARTHHHTPAAAVAAQARGSHHGHRHAADHVHRSATRNVAGTTRHQPEHGGVAGVQRGKASVYAERLRGRRMADGTRFDPASNAAASKTLPLGTTARVTNIENGRTTTVTVRDRGPHARGRILDVSPSSGAALGMGRDGVAPVAVTPTADPLTHGH